MTKIALIGAGSLQFGTGMLGDIFQSRTLSGAEIILHDINIGAANRVLKVGQDYVADKNLDFKLSSEPDLKCAVNGADSKVRSL